jgi:hypothetical protein
MVCLLFRKTFYLGTARDIPQTFHQVQQCRHALIARWAHIYSSTPLKFVIWIWLFLRLVMSI